MYVLNMNKLFQKISVELNTQPSTKEKRKSLLHDIVGSLYVKKLGQKLPPIRIRRLRIKKEDEINIKLTEANQYWNYWKFQITGINMIG